MKYVLVSTQNVQRIFDATKAIEKRLQDSEIMGMGLIFGRPGLGKTMTLDAYHARSHKLGRVRTVFVRAMSHWTETSMLKDVLKEMGQSPNAYRKDAMFDQLRDALKAEPAIIIMDEVDAIAGNRRMIGMLKDMHDVTGCGFLMVGEERVDALLQRYQSFYNRMNRGAVVQVTNHSADDVRLVIQQRCDVEVAPEVCDAIHAETGGRSIRSVIDKIRELEAFARNNDCKRIGAAEYRKVSRGLAVVRPETTPLEITGNEGAING
jgi:Cdc6-like AAA superfamily ATPase